jgi:drug/metabolite transporter (DMT)-like permease
MIGEAAALGAALCWAVGSHLFGRIGKGVPPGALNLGKCMSGACAFALTGLVMSGHLVPTVSSRPLGWLAASGVIGLSLGDSMYFGAMAILGVRPALLLLSTAPVFTAVGGAIFLREPLGALEIASIAAVIAGVSLVVNEQARASTAEAISSAAARPRSSLGVLFGIGSGMAQAAGSLTSRVGMAGGISALDTAIVRLSAGVLGIVVIAALSRRLVPWSRAIAKPRLFAAIAGSAMVGTYAGIWLSQLAIGRARSTAVAATLLATSPIFALPLGRWLNAERLTPRALVGTALACAGLAGLTLLKS